ncbi:MAG: GC-type dockerin domain-anchored protein, partial [Phycisphaerales bacterium]|nr:GC-type dockerin domain-anchored protein [Phycisphaerales bacterium]
NLPLGFNALVNPKPVSLALLDVDDDGDRDMVLVSVNDSGDQTVRVIRNTTVPGNGLSFASVIDAPNQPAGLPLIVRSADLDGDSPMVADDIVVLVDPVSSFTRDGVIHRVGGGGGLNSIDLSGDFCAADLTRDGSLNFLDVSAFLSAFGSQDATADFNSDGSFNFLDVSQFLSQFMNNCGS